jgi:microcompartment protein CcmK/EutM
MWEFENVASGEPNLTLVKSGGNVGIGIATPTVPLQVEGNISGSGLVYFPNIGAGVDNSVIVLDSDGSLRTDEIDSRVWGTTLVDGSGTTNYPTYWSDANTLTAEQYVSVTRGGSGTGTLTGVLKGNGTSDFSAMTSTAGHVAYWSDANTITGENFLDVTRGGTGLGTVGTNYLLTGNGTSALSAEANLTFDGTILKATGSIDLRHVDNGGMMLRDSTGVGLMLGEYAYTTSTSYTGITHTGLTDADDYMMISSGTDTYISAKNTNSVFIRGGGNYTPNQIEIADGTTITFTTTIGYFTGKVGIGTNNPAGNLHINDASSTADLYLDSYDNNNASIIHFNRANIATDTARIVVTHNDGTAQQNSLEFLNGLDESTVKMIILEGGNVGIGTNNPDELFHTYKNTDGANKTKLHNPNAGSSAYISIDFQSDTGKGEIWRNSSTRIGGGQAANSLNVFNANDLWLWSGNANTMVLDSSQRVGIGISTPTVKLQVEGIVSASSTVWFPNIGAGVDDSVVVLDSDGSLRTDEIDSRVWGSTLVDTDGSGANNELATWSDSNTLIGEANLTFDGTHLDLTGAFTASGGAYIAGNVAIGVSTTSHALKVYAPDGDSVRIGTADGGGQAFDIGTDITNKRFYFDPTPSTNTYDFSFIQDGGGTMMLLDQSTGYVGIGTTVPGAQLHLYKGSSDGIITGLLIDASISTGATPFRIRYGGSDANTLMVMDDAGYVGIGIATPTVPLQVEGILSASSTVWFPNIGAGVDNSVIVLDSDGSLRTDEIDSRVWGSTLVDTDGSGTATEIAIWSDADTIAGNSELTYGSNILDIGGGANADLSLTFTAVGTSGRLTFREDEDILQVDTANIFNVAIDTRITGSLAVSGSITISEAGKDLLIPATSKLRFDGDASGDTYIANVGTNEIRIYAGGSIIRWDSANFYANTTNGWLLDYNAASTTNPVYTFNGDSTTGIGRAGASVISLIAGGSSIFQIDSAGMYSGTSGGGKFLDIASTSTVPVFVPDYSDTNTGMG